MVHATYEWSWGHRSTYISMDLVKNLSGSLLNVWESNLCMFVKWTTLPCTHQSSSSWTLVIPKPYTSREEELHSASDQSIWATTPTTCHCHALKSITLHWITSMHVKVTFFHSLGQHLTTFTVAFSYDTSLIIKLSYTLQICHGSN